VYRTGYITIAKQFARVAVNIQVSHVWSQIRTLNSEFHTGFRNFGSTILHPGGLDLQVYLGISFHRSSHLTRAF